MINKPQLLTSWHKKKPKPCKTGASAPVSAVFSGDTLSLAFWLLFYPSSRDALVFKKYKRMKYIVIFLGLTFNLISNSFCQQVSDEQTFAELKMIRLRVIKQSIVGRKFYYDFTKDSSCNNTCITYLGQIKTDKNKLYKIMTCFYVHGQSCRGTSRIVIYNSSNKYLGNYYVGMPEDLPDTIINNRLVYSKNNIECIYRKGTNISFENGLTKTIFIPCDKIDSGDFITFSNDE